MKPNYFKWLWATQKSSVLLTVAGIIACIFATPVILDPANDNPIAAIIVGLIAVYGFTVGMAMYSYIIYRKLDKTDYWMENK